MSSYPLGYTPYVRSTVGQDQKKQNGIVITDRKNEEIAHFSLAGIQSAIRNVTPTLLVVGIATGAAFAIGSGLVHRYLFKEKG